MPKKYTPNQKEFKKQVRRIKRFIKAAEQRGYEFYDLPNLEMPKRVTSKRLSELRKIKPSVLYEKAIYTVEDTGEILTGTQGVKYERSQSALKRESVKRYKSGSTIKNETINFTDAVIREYTRQILRFPSKVSSIVLEALDLAIEKSGRDNVAEAIENKAYSLSDFLNRSAFFGDSIEAIKAYCQSMFGDLPGMDENHIQQVIEATDEEESYFDYEN